MLSSLASLVFFGAVSAVPTSSKALVSRQNPDSLYTCRDAGCTDCPLYFSSGGVTDNGFPPDANGMIRIWIDVPAQDQNCRTLIRTPVRPNDINCGGNVFVAEASFCCGREDCTDAGAPWKRDQSKPRGFNMAAGSGDLLTLYDQDGNMIPPNIASKIQGREPEPQPEPEPEPEPKFSPAVSRRKPNRLTKRDCDGFEVTNGPFTTGGQQYIISDVVTCSPTAECSATIAKEVTETTSFSTEVSVSDPLGIVSVSVGFEYEKSVSQTFEGSWKFGPGERGYVTFIPWITCVEGYFTGDCDDEGTTTQICGGEYSGGNQISGERRPVLIRG
ncbi:aldo/keto reductase family protein [Stemphylium lycopersici]|uniref:Aldo/keto reductase family protein n=1 Tax=Stemphylium lycopersici TaxID=183478 RepID=A0A364N2P1_STELY|nr:aldo/keto reductase family protein [Stemphylium lycopersici]